LLFLLLAGMGLTLPNLSAMAMEPYGRNAGSASALLGTIQFALGSTAGVLVGLFHNGTALPMVSVISTGSLAGLVILLFFTEKPALSILPETAQE
jgi:DHA1 family bicyclomycin/chloramphenicol resistance-like MFS transporter